MRLTLLSHVHTWPRQKGPNSHTPTGFSPITNSANTSFPRDNLSGGAKPVSRPSTIITHPYHHHHRLFLHRPRLQRREPRPVCPLAASLSFASTHPSPSNAIPNRVPQSRGTSASHLRHGSPQSSCSPRARHLLLPIGAPFPLPCLLFRLARRLDRLLAMVGE